MSEKNVECDENPKTSNKPDSRSSIEDQRNVTILFYESKMLTYSQENYILINSTYIVLARRLRGSFLYSFSLSLYDVPIYSI